MAYLRTSLVVLTLLQLCQAEISNKQRESWYSANVINDEFQPKPISEIFSTEASFSSTNPIIVLSKSNEIPDEIAFLSTLPPLPRSSSSISKGFTNILPISSTTVTSTEALPISSTSSSSTSLPSSTIAIQIQTTSEETPAPPILPLFHPISTEIQPVPPLVTTEPAMVQSSLPDVQTHPIVQPIPPVDQLDPPAQPLIQPLVLPVQSNSGQPSRSQSSQNQSQQIRLELIPQIQTLPIQPTSNPQGSPAQQVVSQLPNVQPSTLSPQSNYFLIYQQAPQNIQNYPLPAQATVSISQAPVISTVTSQSSIPQPMPTVSAPSVPSSPPQMVTFAASLPSQTVPSISSPIQPVSTTIINTMPTTKTLPTTSLPSTTNRPNTARPLPSIAKPTLRNNSTISLYPLRIRVIAPRGSITNVKINPATTTKKPKTPRTRKPRPKARNNSYDVCIDSCKGRRDPICAAPLSPGLIEPKNLKGFPSICHMACHNSFRKDTYEKLVDGRCGKLRTRIRTVDSSTKLKKDELIKSEYTLDNTGPKTIVEFSGSIN